VQREIGIKIVRALLHGDALKLEDGPEFVVRDARMRARVYARKRALQGEDGSRPVMLIPFRFFMSRP
jgi:hypothetical protein